MSAARLSPIMITGAPVPSPTFLGRGEGSSAGRGGRRSYFFSRGRLGFGSMCLESPRRSEFRQWAPGSSVLPVVPSALNASWVSPFGASVGGGDASRASPRIAWSPRLRLSMRVAVQPSGVSVGGGRPVRRNSYRRGRLVFGSQCGSRFSPVVWVSVAGAPIGVIPILWSPRLRLRLPLHYRADYPGGEFFFADAGELAL
jgi:hypothetical protein